MNYKELTEQLVEKGLKLGASSTEVYLESNRDLSISILNGEIETIEEASSAGVGFRVLVDGRMGFSHCNDLTDQSLEDTMKRAIEFAKLTTADEYNVFPDNHGETKVDGLYDGSISSVTMEEKIRMALDLEKLAMLDPLVAKSSGSSFGEGEYEVFIANSNGISSNYKSSGCSIGVSVVAEKGDQKNTGGEYCVRRFFSDLDPISKIAESASKKAKELIDPVMVPTQRASVIFDPSVAGSLFGGILGAINGERVIQGASFLKNSLNQQFASELITIVDDGTRARGLGSAPFDGEGVPTQKRVLVEQGVLKGFIYNTIAAKRAGVKSTGNASRSGFSSLPGIGIHNLYVEAGKYAQEEIIRNTEKGILLKGVTGYGINPVNGNFSGGASGLWIENGKIVHPVKGLTIAGSADEILMAIDMLGDDLDLNKSFAAPSIRISEMQIGGK
jgi:PmbA protein